MAVNFDGSATYISASGSISTQCSIAAIIRFSAIAETFIAAAYTASGGVCQLFLTAGGNIACYTGSLVSPFGAQATSASTISLNTWYFVGGVHHSATDRRVYLDTAEATNTANKSMGSLDTMVFAGGVIPFSQYLADGDIAEVAFWNVGLTAAEFAVLSDRFCPEFVRPNSLQGYCRMANTSDVVNRWGSAASLTGSGATNAEHPRIIYHTRSKVFPFTAAAAATIESLGGLHHIGMGMGDPGVARLPQTLHTIDKGIAL